MIERITVYLNQERKTKLPLDQPEFPLKRFSFSMCNPPFYRSKQEQEELRQRKRGQPSLNTVAKPDELFTEGGEQQFVLEMADESQKLGTRVQWYTTMVGRKGTLAELRARVRKLGAKQVKEGTLLQGVTTRWVLAWSFEDKSCFSVAVSKSSVGEAQKWFEQSMHELDIETGEAEDGYRCAAREITWTRKARRQREKAGASGAPAATGDEQPRSVLVFAASVHDVCTTDAGSAKQEIHMRYLSGEAGPNSLASLYNHLLRQLRQA
ncbi:hypothetical protein LPJ53_005897 [Coemansia erecta]|uniref:Uncharacterized protein n=1 Tax=Coemansia erecta TaxID=147472 RepID=A0A9W8CNA7_9FUNG|nr:hypothetical protein LPJ53_005897 [Coemansia erecta]